MVCGKGKDGLQGAEGGEANVNIALGLKQEGTEEKGGATRRGREEQEETRG